MKVRAEHVAAVVTCGDAAAVDGLFRRVLADRVPAGTAQPRWVADRGLTGVFSGYGAVRDFAEWCEVFDTDPEFEYGPPPELVLFCHINLAGHRVRLQCIADEREVGACFRLNPGSM